MAMSDLTVHAAAKRVGNSLAVFIPAAAARSAGIKEGDLLDIRIRPHAAEPFGFAKRLGLDVPSFDRRADGMWRDRV